MIRTIYQKPVPDSKRIGESETVWPNRWVADANLRVDDHCSIRSWSIKISIAVTALGSGESTKIE